MSEISAEPGADTIVSDYFTGLDRVLKRLPEDRRDRIIADLRDHVTAALAEGASAREVLDSLGTPEDIAGEAFADPPAAASATTPVPAPATASASATASAPATAPFTAPVPPPAAPAPAAPSAAAPRQRRAPWAPRAPWGPWWSFRVSRVSRRPRPPYVLALAAVALAVVIAVAGGIAGYAVAGHPSPANPAASAFRAATTAGDGDSACSSSTATGTTAAGSGATGSGGSARALTATATEVASGTVGGQAWTLWSGKGASGPGGLEGSSLEGSALEGSALEDGGLVLDGRVYALCPGVPDPTELELADVSGHGIAYGVIGYPGLAKVRLYRSTAGTFGTGATLPAPAVRVVDGVSFFIGALPQSACAYPSLELNATAPGVSAEHNLGFGPCTAGRLVPVKTSRGSWGLPADYFAVRSAPSPTPAASSGSGVANVPNPISTCAPATLAVDSGGPASALTATATQVASGTVAGLAWSLWSADGQTGAQGLEDGGLVINDRAYGLCPGFTNPAELELADVTGQGIAYGVIGYPGLAQVWLYRSSDETFDTTAALPAPSVRVIHGVSFFIGALPQSACDYPSLELNSTSPGASDEHNLGYGPCTAGQLVPIYDSQGTWQLTPGHFVQNLP